MSTHKPIHNATWVSPNHNAKNQMDICSTEKSRRSMEDVRTRIRADIASECHIVIAKMKLKLKKHCKTRQTALRKFNTALF